MQETIRGGLLGGFGTSTRSTVASSYWDTEASVRNFGIGADDTDNDNCVDDGPGDECGDEVAETNTLANFGLNTSQMQAANGTNFIFPKHCMSAWSFYDGSGTAHYPRLKVVTSGGADNNFVTCEDIPTAIG